MDCKTHRVQMNSGNSIPIIGFGTYLITGSTSITNVLDYALAAGYRSFDTAAVYNNEKHIGEALKVLLPKYNLRREEIFITSKLDPSDQGEKAYEAVRLSLKHLGLEYLDLFLIHWPGAGGLPGNSPENKTRRTLSWKNLIKAQKEGLVKSIGVSNYTIRHLEELMAESRVKPDLNQVPWNPFFYHPDWYSFSKKNNIVLQAYSSFGGTNNKEILKSPVVASLAAQINRSPAQCEWHPQHFEPELLEFCRKHNIVLQAYSSLGGTRFKGLLEHPVVKSVSQDLHKTSSQVLLRWAIQQEIPIIPKASSKERICENMDLNFEIPQDDMKRLNDLNINRRLAWNPQNIA